MLDSVEYLGHRIDAEGIHTSASKVEAIVKAPAPKNITELCFFLGMVNYHGKFIPNVRSFQTLSTYALLKTGVKWNWTEECFKVFTQIKNRLSEAPVLVHYNPKLPVRLAGNASNGIIAVLSYIDCNCQEHQSHLLLVVCLRTTYSQVDKEALSRNPQVL